MHKDLTKKPEWCKLGWLLIVVCPVASCSIGTEVGNGLRPFDRRTERDENPESSSRQGNPNSPGKMTPVSEGNHPPPPSGFPQSGMPQSSTERVYMLSALVQSCASPWAEDIQSPVRLTGEFPQEDTLTTLEGSRTGNPGVGEWNLLRAGEQLTVTPTPLIGKFAGLVVAASGPASNPQGVCGPVQEATTSPEPNVVFHDRTVSVTFSDSTYVLSWRVVENQNSKALRFMKVESPSGNLLELKDSSP